MKTRKQAKAETAARGKKIARFIVLVPHRDSLGRFQAYRAKLFAEGFCGAHSFPLCAPIASVARAFTAEELKALARNIREQCADSGKIFTVNGADNGAKSGASIAGAAFLIELSDLGGKEKLLNETEIFSLITY